MIRCWPMAVAAILSMTGCGGLPVDWDGWRVPTVDSRTPEMLLSRARHWKHELVESHLSEEGLLLYRIPQI